MIEMKIPKEIRRYESKLIGPFTGRQTACVIGMAGVVGVVKFLLADIIPSDVQSLVAMLVCVPLMLFGWYKPYGMKFEEFAMLWYFTSFRSAPKRKYKSKSYYDELLNQKNEKKSKNAMTKEEKEHIKDIAKKKKASQYKAIL